MEKKRKRKKLFLEPLGSDFIEILAREENWDFDDMRLDDDGRVVIDSDGNIVTLRADKINTVLD